MNTSQEDDRCRWYLSYGDIAYTLGYYVATPIYFILGGLGHVICMVAFYRQRKKDKAYMYQVFMVVSETIEIITYTAYSTTFYWFSGSEGTGGASWFMSCYPCMWYTGKMVVPMVNMFITSSLFFSVALVADRVYAMSRPFSYKTINHAVHQVLACLCCYFIGISTSIFDAGWFQIGEKHQNGTNVTHYELVANEAFVGSTLGKVSAQVRNAVRTFGVIILVSLNFTLVIKYRAHNKKMVTVGSKDAASEARRRSTERVLILLAVLGSMLNAISMSMLIAYFAKVYFTPNFYGCEGALLGPITDGMIQMMEIGDFYLAFCVSKQFRDVVATAVPWFARIFKMKPTDVPAGSMVQAGRSSNRGGGSLRGNRGQ